MASDWIKSYRKWLAKIFSSIRRCDGGDEQGSGCSPPPLEDPEQFSFLRQGTKPGLQRSQAPLAATAQWKASRMDGGLSQHGRGSAWTEAVLGGLRKGRLKEAGNQMESIGSAPHVLEGNWQAYTSSPELCLKINFRAYNCWGVIHERLTARELVP